MTTNHFFQPNAHPGQQNLAEDLTIEMIKIHGVDMHYLPRNDSPGNTDEYFGEDHNADFNREFLIEMYLNNAEGFDGEGDLLAKFGLIVKDTATLTVSRLRFKTETDMPKPREGDLLYFPLSNTLLEIKYVSSDNPFFQFGKLYTYELQVETFQYTGETFNTGIDKVDRVEREDAYSVVFGITGASGDFAVSESVTNGSVTAKVRSWSGDNLEVYKITGEFSEGDIITGTQSGVTGAVLSEDDMIMNEDPFSENREIQDDGDGFMDWSESTPFGDL